MRAVRGLFIAVAILLSLPMQSAWSNTSTEQSLDTKYQWLVLDEVNKYRQSRGLKPLKMNDYMIKEARVHSMDMATKRMAFGHKDFDKRIKRIYDHIQLCRSGSENIAYFKINPREVVRKWLTSPGHKRNIEGNFNLTGVGVVRDKNGWVYYTQIFVRTDNPKYLNKPTMVG